MQQTAEQKKLMLKSGQWPHYSKVEDIKRLEQLSRVRLKRMKKSFLDLTWQLRMLTQQNHNKILLKLNVHDEYPCKRICSAGHEVKFLITYRSFPKKGMSMWSESGTNYKSENSQIWKSLVHLFIKMFSKSIVRSLEKIKKLSKQDYVTITFLKHTWSNLTSFTIWAILEQ